MEEQNSLLTELKKLRAQHYIFWMALIEVFYMDGNRGDELSALLRRKTEETKAFIRYEAEEGSAEHFGYDFETGLFEHEKEEGV